VSSDHLEPFVYSSTTVQLFVSSDVWLDGMHP